MEQDQNPEELLTPRIRKRTGPTAESCLPPEYRHTRTRDHYHKLVALRKEVYENSALHFRLRNSQNGNCGKFPFPPSAPVLEKDPSAIEDPMPRYYQRVDEIAQVTELHGVLYSFIDSHNMMYNLCANIGRIQEKLPNVEEFPILTIIPYRTDVANLQPISFKSIRDVAKDHRRFLRECFENFVCRDDLGGRTQLIEREKVVHTFIRIATDNLGEKSTLFTNDIFMPYEGHPILRLLHCMIMVLDAGLVSYVGGHIDTLDQRIFAKPQPTIPLLPNSLHELEEDIFLVSRKLKCLDGFLHGRKHLGFSTWR